MGDSSNVFPVAMGVIVFIVVLTMVLTISSFQQTTVNSPQNIQEKESSDPSQLLGTQYVDWIPNTGHKVNVTNTSNNYYTGGVIQFGKNSLNMDFTDPNYATHTTEVRIIRNNSAYGSSGWTIDDVDFGEYLDYMVFEGYVDEWGVHWNFWIKSISFDLINTSQVPGRNYSLFDIGAYNVSGMVMVPGNGTNFFSYLYGNNYTIYIVQYPNIDYNDFWQVLWWIISFNNAWMPEAPWIALVVSFMVDIALALMMLFIAQGFIP